MNSFIPELVRVNNRNYYVFADDKRYPVTVKPSSGALADKLYMGDLLPGPRAYDGLIHDMLSDRTTTSEASNGFIYIVGANPDLNPVNRVKLGYTTDSTEGRLAKLQTANTKQLHVIAEWYVSEEKLALVEAALLEVFSYRNVQVDNKELPAREWFNLSYFELSDLLSLSQKSDRQLLVYLATMYSNEQVRHRYLELDQLLVNKACEETATRSINLEAR